MAFFPLGIPSRALDANGDPVSGAKLYVYEAGTSTPATVYQDAALTTPHASPIVADSDGIWGPIWAAVGDYKVNATDADDATLPGFPIDNIEPLTTNDDLADALSTLQNGTATFIDRAALAAATVPASVKRVYVFHHTASNHEGNAENTFVSGHHLKRVSFADIDGVYPASAYVRSTDRFMPAGTTNATNGGYWLIDEASPTVAMFGAIGTASKDGSNVISGTDCSQAAQDWIDFYQARGGGDGVRRNIGRMVWGAGFYRLSRGIDFSVLAGGARIYTVDGGGATIYCDCADEIAFDFTDAEYFRLIDFLWYGDPANPPLCAVKAGRIANNNTAARWEIHHCSTRIDASSESTWRVAALWVVQSEATYTSGNFWENYRALADDNKAVAAAYDTTNTLDWENGITIDSITQANPGVVTTAASHGLTTGDVVAFAGDCTMDELVGTLYKVVVTSATTFTLTDLDDTAINTAGYMAYSTGSGKQFVYKQKFGRGTSLSMHATGDIATSPSAKERGTTPAPNDRESAKHNVHIKDTYSCTYGRAAIWQGACEDNHFIGCFGVGQTGFWARFDDLNQCFSRCTFQLHLEGGVVGGTNDWMRFSRTAVDATATPQLIAKCFNCEFTEISLTTDTYMFRLDEGDEEVHFLGGNITVSRYTQYFLNGNAVLFSNNSKFFLHGTNVCLDDAGPAGVEVCNAAVFSGWLTNGTDLEGTLRLPLYTVSTLPNTSWYEGGLIIVTDETGGETLAFSDNNNWRRVQDRNIVS